MRGSAQHAGPLANSATVIPARLPVDIKHFTGGRVDIDLHISARHIPPLDLPFVTGELSAGYGDKTKVGRNVQCCLHRNEAARVIGRGGRCHAEPYGCNDWNDIFSHGLLLVEAILPVTPSAR